MPQGTDQSLIDKCAEYLRTSYGEELVKCTVLQDRVEEGEGRLVTECVVRVGGSTSRWQKTFTFEEGDVVHMSWKHLG